MDVVDEQVRKDILNARGNIVVSASAGSGKTTIMIKKIIKKLEEVSDHRTVAAITFTIKATEEIKKKLKQQRSNDKNVIVMTNDSFIEYEIIRPFLLDVFDENFSKDFVISYEANVKFNSFDEGLLTLKKFNKLGTYSNSTKKNFKFELAKKILIESKAAQEYLKSKYVMIFLDEYQDSDMDMHNLFMYIKNNLLINLFIVGDSKQAIYLWRGAQKNIFSKLEDEGMNKFELVTNFRSHFEIVNYANLIHNKSQFIDYYPNTVTHTVLCKTNDHINSIIKLCESGTIDKNKEITIIININNHAKIIANKLNEQGFDFIFIPKTPLDDGSENSTILKAIACYLLDENYSIYDIAEVLRIEQSKTYLDKIAKLFDPLKKVIPLLNSQSKNDIYDTFIQFIDRFNTDLGATINNEEKNIIRKYY